MARDDEQQAMTSERVVQALRLLEQVERCFAFENGLIDPSDYDLFSAFDLLQIAEGKVKMDDMVWGQGNAAQDPEQEAEAERRRLAEWNARALLPSERSGGDGA